MPDLKHTLPRRVAAKLNARKTAARNDATDEATAHDVEHVHKRNRATKKRRVRHSA